MAQLKPCPPSKIEAAKAKARQQGMRCFVLFDNLAVEHKVINIQTYRGGGYVRTVVDGQARYEIVASVDPD